MDLDQGWLCKDRGSSVIATAIHAGHELRPEVKDVIAIDDATRAREEDPHTDRFTSGIPSRIVVGRSRFEVDLNRPRSKAVYREPGDAFGLEVWKQPWTDGMIARSLETYDRFYRTLEGMLQTRIAAGRAFVVLDIHSYNHRRAGPDAPPEDIAGNPDLNVGTGTLDRHRWGSLVRDFIDNFRSAAGGLDVRENVRFQGGSMAKWIHSRYGKHGCCFALEFKKTFMDEWTGELDRDRLAELVSALTSTVPQLEDRAAAA